MYFVTVNMKRGMDTTFQLRCFYLLFRSMKSLFIVLVIVQLMIWVEDTESFGGVRCGGDGILCKVRKFKILKK